MSNYDPTDIRSQERAKADTDLRNRLAKDTEESDLKWLMGSKRGRRIVWRLASNANYDLMYCFCSIFLNNSLGRPIVSDDSPMPKLVICERHPSVLSGCDAGFVHSKF